MLLPFLLHHLGDRLYGFWALAGTFVGYYGVLDFGLTGTVSQYISSAIGRKNFQECNLVFNAALRIHLSIAGIALVITSVLAALAPLFFHTAQDAALFWRVILLVGTTVALGFPLNSYQGLLVAELRYDIIAWLSVLGLTLRTGLTVWVVLAGHGLIGIAWVGLLTRIPTAFLTVWLTRKQAPWSRILIGPTEPKMRRSLFSYSTYVFTTDIADLLRFQLDPIVITAFVGLAAVTHYRIASVLSDQYMRVVISVVGVFWPLLSRLHGAGDDVRIRKTFFFATKFSLFAANFLCFGLITWGRPTIQIWMGPAYMDSYWPLVVLTLSILFYLWQMPTVDLLYATFKHRVVAFASLAEGFLNLGVSLILVQRYGILGVAIGTLVAAVIVRVIVLPWWMCKVSKISFPVYVRWYSGIIFRCAGIIAVSVPLVSWGLRPDYRYLLVSAIWASILYVVGSWVAVFDNNEREVFLAVLKNLIRRREAVPVEVRCASAKEVGVDVQV